MKSKLEETSRDLADLWDLYPMDFSGTVTKPSSEMKEGLAFAFGNLGFRKFMENCIRHVNKSLIEAHEHDHMVYYRAQMKTLMEIMSAGKAVFVDSELHKNRSSREKALLVEKAEKDLTIKEK